MVQKVRRVVTGHEDNGKSMVLIDGVAGNVKEMESMPGLALTAGVTALDAGLAARRLVQKRSGLATIAKRSHE